MTSRTSDRDREPEGSAGGTATSRPDDPHVPTGPAGTHPSLGAVRFAPYWLDSPLRPTPRPPLAGAETCDLAVVGAGLMGLWAALLQKERDPSSEVVVLEAVTAGWAASGRNGGFCMSTLTHGTGNAIARFPDEYARLEEFGLENLDAVQQAVSSYGIDCDWQRTGEVMVATAPWQMEALREDYRLMRELGRDVALLDRDEMRAEVDSPTYVGAVWDRDGCAMADPARLVWGLRRACLERGVRIYEGTPVRGLKGLRDGVGLTAPGGHVRARRVVLATNVFRSLVPRVRPYVVPVYDYALMTEPLTEDQRASIGWRSRFGMADQGNQFHYYRLTDDGRMLWGGYDAVFYAGGRIHSTLDHRPQTFDKLAANFFATFPQLEGVRFSHAWGGAIDTCSRLYCFWGTAMRGRVAYALGYTGNGVAETRFGALACLDLLDGGQTERARLQLVRSRPLPFPPEPARTAVVQLTRWSLARADERQGRRNLWLRTLDRFGLGFDS